MKLSNISLPLWLGSEESYHVVTGAETQLAALEAKGPEALAAKVLEMRGGNAGSNPFELPPLYTVQDGVAVLKIEGPLVNGSAGFMRLFGVLGYDDIRNAALEAMSQKSVNSILLHVNSGGGSAAGTEETSGMLKKIGTVKPVHTYSDGVMASAAYWIGSAGSHIGVAKTATVGSVGVIAVHMDRSKQLENDGIKATVIRAGEFKQPANPFEPLTPAAKEHMTALAEDMYSVFADSVASNLGVTREKFDATMGRGREFLGVKGTQVGLAHAVMTYDEAFAHAKNVDKSKLNRENSRNPSNRGSSMKATLATALLLQLVAGTAVTAMDFTKAEATMEGVVPDAEAQTFLKAQAIEIGAAIKTAQEAAVAAAVTPLKSELDSVKATLSTTNVELGSLRTNASALTAQTQTLEAAVASTEKVLHGSIATMCVALGATDTSKDLKGAALLAEHERLEAVFVAKFPNARISAVTTTGDTKAAVKQGSELPEFARVASGLRKAA